MHRVDAIAIRLIAAVQTTESGRKSSDWDGDRVDAIVTNQDPNPYLINV